MWRAGALSAIAGMAMASSAFGATANAPTPVAPLDEVTCAHPPLAQVLLPFGDANNYALAPGGAFSDAGGWELTGGATITTATQPDGTVGGVLQLPYKGAQASSPPMCITSDYPMARLWARGEDDLSFNVTYWRDGAWTKPKNNGMFKGQKTGWGLSKEMNIDPAKDAGWQQVRFLFYADGKNAVQVDNFWVDPRASR
jgi:hypothetical protein